MVKRHLLRNNQVVCLSAGPIPDVWNATRPGKRIKERRQKVHVDLPDGQERFTRDEVLEYGQFAPYNLPHLVKYGYLTFIQGTVSRAELEHARACYEFIPADIRRGDW